MMSRNSKIYIAGHKGLVGSAILRKLKVNGYSKIITADRKNLDLTNQSKVFSFLKKISQILYLLLPQRSAAYTQITSIKLNLFIKI